MNIVRCVVSLKLGADLAMVTSDTLVGPFSALLADFAGVALIGCDVDGDGNLTMSNSIVEDVGWHGGAGLVFSQESNGNIVFSSPFSSTCQSLCVTDA